MKGNIATFLSVLKNLFLLSIFSRLVDFFYQLSHCCVDLPVREYFLCGIDEKDISAAAVEVAFLFPPAFSDPSLEQIALDCAFEHFFGNGYHYAVIFAPVTWEVDATQACHVTMTTFGK